MDRGGWWAAVHGVAGSQKRLSDFTFTFRFHALEKEMATHSGVLAWKIPWTEQSGWLYSPWGCKESNVNELEYEHKVYTSRLLLLLSRFSCARLCEMP